MRILVCGSREFADKLLMRWVLKGLIPKKPITIIEGAARGADQMAAMAARELHFEVEEYPPDWPRYHRAAGIIRNQQMLDEGLPDAVIAFSTTYPLTPGTRDMVERALKADLPVEIHTSAKETR